MSVIYEMWLYLVWWSPLSLWMRRRAEENNCCGNGWSIRCWGMLLHDFLELGFQQKPLQKSSIICARCFTSTKGSSAPTSTIELAQPGRGHASQWLRRSQWRVHQDSPGQGVATRRDMDVAGTGQSWVMTIVQAQSTSNNSLLKVCRGPLRNLQTVGKSNFGDQLCRLDRGVHVFKCLCFLLRQVGKGSNSMQNAPLALYTQLWCLIGKTNMSCAVHCATAFRSCWQPAVTIVHWRKAVLCSRSINTGIISISLLITLCVFLHLIVYFW